MRWFSQVMLLRAACAVLSFVTLPVFGDLTFYGVKFPTKGPRSSGVIRVELPNFPWLSTRRVQSQYDLDRILHRGQDRQAETQEAVSQRAVKPAILYLSRQSASVEKSNLARRDFHYFFQEDVKVRLDQYLWYWVNINSTAFGLLQKTYGLKHQTGLMIFEPDGTVLHIEAPVNDAASVARAMRMIDYKRRMEAALKTDLPFLRTEFKEGHYKTLVKYLQYADKNRMYASARTEKVLASIRKSVNDQGEELIKKAETLASNGDEKTALKILQVLTRDFKPLEAAAHARDAAKKIRGG